MFDIGMSELLVIGTVALIVIGPKDLPELFRSLGRMTAKMRAMSREFSRAMEAAADESGVKDVADDLRRATSAKSMGLDAVKDAASKFEKWDPLKPAPRAAPKPGPRPDPGAGAPKGPATRALADAQTARKAEALNSAEMLKKPLGAKGPPPSAGQSTQPAAKAAVKPRVSKTATKPPAVSSATAKPEVVKKPRAPRKPKADV